MSDIDKAFDDFADATEASLVAMRDEIRAFRAEMAQLKAEMAQLKAEMAQLKEETRNAPVTHPSPNVEPVPGKDGVGVAGVSIREGDLFLRYTDGREENVGRVVGKDGKDGIDGKDGRNGVDGKDGERGADGINGRDGKDGIATREEIESIVTREVETRFADVQVRSFADTYQDVFKHGESYSRGMTATWEGSLWLALRDTNAQPGTQDSGWKLITKKGRDGRDRR